MLNQECLSKKTGQPLRSYHFEFEAQSAAEYSMVTYSNELVPYECGRCKLWHLAPKSRHTPSKTCTHCLAGDGSNKEAYRSKKEAITRAEILYQEQGVELDVYRCKHGSGWHLTKAKY